jgi:hypothetical protein
MRRGRTQAHENAWYTPHIVAGQSRDREGAVRSLTLAALFRQRLTLHFRNSNTVVSFLAAEYDNGHRQKQT